MTTVKDLTSIMDSKGSDAIDLTRITVRVGHKWANHDPDIPLQSWIDHGPNSYYPWVGPTDIEVDGKSAPYTVVPTLYRNIHTSNFLIAAGLYTYPWSHIHGLQPLTLTNFDGEPDPLYDVRLNDTQAEFDYSSFDIATLTIADAWHAGVYSFFPITPFLLLSNTALKSPYLFPIDSEGVFLASVMVDEATLPLDSTFETLKLGRDICSDHEEDVVMLNSSRVLRGQYRLSASGVFFGLYIAEIPDRLGSPHGHVVAICMLASSNQSDGAWNRSQELIRSVTINSKDP